MLWYDQTEFINFTNGRILYSDFLATLRHTHKHTKTKITDKIIEPMILRKSGATNKNRF